MWVVYGYYESMTSEQLEVFTDLWAGNTEFSSTEHGNNRDIQNVNGREVRFYDGEDDDMALWVYVGLGLVTLLV